MKKHTGWETQLVELSKLTLSLSRWKKNSMVWSTTSRLSMCPPAWSPGKIICDLPAAHSMTTALFNPLCRSMRKINQGRWRVVIKTRAVIGSQPFINSWGKRGTCRKVLCRMIQELLVQKEVENRKDSFSVYQKNRLLTETAKRAIEKWLHKILKKGK